MALKIAQWLFVGSMLSFLAVGLFIVGYIIAEALFTIVRVWKPNFGVYQHPESPAQKKATSHADVKRISLDYLMQAKIAQQKRLKKQLEDLLKPKNEPQPEEELEVLPMMVMADMDTLKVQSKPKRVQPKRQMRPADRKDRWCVARFPYGIKRPQFLCRKLSVRGQGLRTAWAPLQKERWTADLESARRLSEQLEGSVVLPANASARTILKRNQLRQEANLKPEEAHICESETIVAKPEARL